MFQEDRMIRKVILSMVMTLSVVLISHAQESEEAKKAETKKTETKKATARKETKEKMKEIATIETSLGKIEVELFSADAPKTVENFVKLAEKKYFDGTIFHRVSKGFVIQGGDPTGTGSGGTSIWGKEFDDELNPNSPSYKEGYKKGVVAMANRGPNTNTSQFFIMLRDNRGLPKNYTIFGKVVEGMDVVDKIGQVDITPQMGPNDGKPKVDVVMKKVTIRREKLEKE
jgi:cyclophilin family peptidyl-prolyl cis-trans isomerase